MTEKNHLYFRCCLNIQLHFDQICYIHFLHWFSSSSILGCSMLHCMCSMLHCMLTSHVLVGSSSVWVETDFICLLIWNVWVALVLISNSKFFTNSLWIKASSQSFFLVAVSSLKTLALRFDRCLLAHPP